jgi:hypothetical protein
MSASQIQRSIEVIPGVAQVERWWGSEASAETLPTLLIEVPHGADERAHFDALRARLVGDLPEDLHVFFHVNTDIGAWELGKQVTERLLDAQPTKSALLIRCLIPRTFIDANRLEATEDKLGAGGMTAGVAPYVDDPRDIALLLQLHRDYVRLVEKAYDEVCARGGLAFSPHTYGPYVLPIAKIDREIVPALRACHAPEVRKTLAVRPEIDLLTLDAERVRHAPEGLVDALLQKLTTVGFSPTEASTYTLHPSTQLWRFVAAHPGQVFALEVRRDLLVEAYEPTDAMLVDAAKVARVAAPIAEAILACP